MRICLIDDQPIVLQTISAFLESLGHQLCCYSSGEELQAMQEANGVPRADVVITDLRLPGLNGTRLIQVVRDLFPGTPIVVISGHWTALMSVQDAVENDVYAFLHKPFSLVELEFLLLRLAKCREDLEKSARQGAS